jgi:hypothetical protein
VQGVGNNGGHVDSLLRNTLAVLGVKNELSLPAVGKRVSLTSPAPPAYWVETATSLYIATNPDQGGHDLDPVHNTGDLIRLIYTRPGTFDLGGGSRVQEQTFPTDVPRNVLMDVLHSNPTKALHFSEQVEVPVYAVDQAQQSETRLREVPLQAAAAAIFRRGHVWAVVRGDDGWYANDDARPSHQVHPSELDEQPNGRGGMAREINVILFKRGD